MGTQPGLRSSPSLTGLVIIATLALAGCFDDSDSDDLVNANVSAEDGGTFSADSGKVSVTIPPGALAEDARLRIRRAGDVPMASGNMTVSGPAYDIDLDGATLDAPIEITIVADDLPEHPEIGELARLEGGQWQRLSANFLRRSESRVIGLTEENSIFAPVNRTLQTTSGDSVVRGQDIFLYETFDNEDFFGGAVGLHTVLNDLAPADAVAAGVQVDIAKVPESIANVLLGNDFGAKQAALQDPAVTRALIKADAVVGVQGFYADSSDQVMSSAGITCALCHVTVEPTEFELSEGETTPLPIGALKLDGMPNYAMDAGLILSLTPFAQNAGQPTVDLLQSWGPGRFDVRSIPGPPTQPLDDSVNNPTKFPPLWNFLDLAQQGYMFNWDGLFASAEAPDHALGSQAEAVYDLVMQGNGAFGTSTGTLPPELSITPPESLLTALANAEAATPGNVIPEQALLDVQAWERSLTSPAPGDYDEALAEEGFRLFYGEANCSGCHQTAEFTGPVVTGEITDEAPQGGLAGGIKTPGLRGIAKTAPYFHDGSAETLEAVVQTYARNLDSVPVDLTEQEISAIAEYLRTL